MLLVGNGRLITRDEAFPYAEDGAARVATLEAGGAFDEARIDEIKRRLEADDEHPDD